VFNGFMDAKPVTRKEPLSGGQLALVFVWLGGWSWVVLSWFSMNQSYGGWFDDLVAPIAVIGWIIGAGFVGLVAGIARYVFSSPNARYAVLVGLPGLATVWLLVASG
jgi:hypothetical protein